MAASPVVVNNNPLYLNARTNVYTAMELRKTLDDSYAQGVQDYDSFRVRQNVGGAAMNVDCCTASVLNRAYVRGNLNTDQGIYRVDYNGVVLNIDVPAADITNPRIDSVFLRVNDAQITGVSNNADLVYVSGTATAGATLDNRTGAPGGGTTRILLADILVPANAVSIVNANIRDRRPVGNDAMIPPLQLNASARQFDATIMRPHAAIERVQPTVVGCAVAHNNNQVLVACWLERRIASALNIRWKYIQATAGALTGQYSIGIFDASGTFICSTGVVALLGAAGSFNVIASAISGGARTFEAGMYYVGIGFQLLAGATGGLFYTGSRLDQSGALGPGCNTQNVAIFSATGGNTWPSAISGASYVDVSSQAVAVAAPAVPLITLSSG